MNVMFYILQLLFVIIDINGPTLNENLVVEKNLTYKNKQIEIVSEYNYIGIELENKLTMEKHINKSVGKANKKLFMIYQLRKQLHYCINS